MKDGDSAQELQKTSFDVLGICCPSEVSLIERLLKPLNGVERVSVNVPSRTVTVVHDPRLTSSTQLAKALNQARLDASIQVPGQIKSGRKWPNPYTVASGFLLVIAFFKYIYSPLQWVALGAVAVGLPPIILKAIVALRGFVLDINMLMLIAVAGAIGLGDYLEAGAIVFLFTLAEWLESRSNDKARAAIASVMNLAPQTAVLEETGVSVPVKDVEINTLVSVKAGETVPIDGVVISGRSSVDESSLTGESMPVEKDVGANVWAGTMNLTGYLCVKTVAVASESAVSRMIKLVEEAQNQRSRTDHFIQHFAKYYTPAVVLVAAGISVAALIHHQNEHHWLYLALVLLVVACPCALVISTPVATTCGLAQAAKMGLVIKGGNYLESLGRIKAIAFDKTGTLTQGQFRVVDMNVVDESIDKNKMLLWMSSLESKSSHPMATALVAYCREQGVEPSAEVTKFQILEGQGILGFIDGHKIHVGNARMAIRLGWIQDPSNTWSCQGTSVGYVGVDEKLAIVFSAADQIRHKAAEAVKELKKLGIQLLMLTGDSASAAEIIQRQVVEITSHSQLLPADKVKIIQDLKKVVGMTAMVGDGINDAPALAAADIGIAMGVAGSAVAMETSDIALMSNDIRKIAGAVKLGRRSLNTIYINVAISLLTKAAIFALSFTVYASLWVAVVADVGTCLIVTFNSMLLLRSQKYDRDLHSHTRHHHANNNNSCCRKQNNTTKCEATEILTSRSSCCGHEEELKEDGLQNSNCNHDHEIVVDMEPPANQQKECCSSCKIEH